MKKRSPKRTAPGSRKKRPADKSKRSKATGSKPARRNIIGTKPAEQNKTAAARSNATKSDPAVAAFLESLNHPLKPELLELRKLILRVSPAVTEEFKWNSPSFRTSDHFATINVTGKNQLRLILHTGAKKKASAQAGLDIPDPTGLLKWLGKDRAMVTFDSANDLKQKSAALKKILVHWIKLI